MNARCLGLTVLMGWACAWAVAAVEEQISSAPLADIEFDSARNGHYCADCNHGDGNSRITFVALNGELWVGRVDWTTGRLDPEDGRGTLVDTNAAYFTAFGNGPTWVFSQRGSELVYTRYADGMPSRPEYAGLGWARMTGPGAWVAGPVPDGQGRVAAKGTQQPEDAVPRVSYGSVARDLAWWRTGDFESPEVVLPLGDSNRGLGLRWVAGTSLILLSGGGPGGTKQTFAYDTSTASLEQITSGSGNKRAQFMFHPPEFGGEAIFFAVVDDTRFDFYRRQPDRQGQLRWNYFRSIVPPPDQPFIAGSPEAFVHNGRSWIAFTMSNSARAAAPSRVAIASIDPAAPEIRVLTAPDAPERWRSDPEFFINDSGVYIYFTRARLDRLKSANEGLWRVHTGLGPATRR